MRTVDVASEGALSRSTLAAAGEKTEHRLQGRVRAWTAALVLLCAGSLWLQFRHIENSLPYPHHVDEQFVAGPARRMLINGRLNPGEFIYPSLPSYLAAIGIGAGFVRSAGDLEGRDIRLLGSVTYPYYKIPRAMQTARQLFALLAVIGLAATGVASWFAFRTPSAIFLSPLVLWTSPLFFDRSWRYLNVDIVSTCFVMLTLAACLQGTRQPSIRQCAIIPGLFAGLATGSKYTSALVVAPVLLAILIYVKAGHRIWACLAALATMIAAFLIVVPYSLLDIPTFLNGLAFDARHYAEGHIGFDGEPGLTQLSFYARHFVSDFGVGAVILAVLGVIAYGAADWRRAAILVSFPLGLLWLLASHRVHFTRNVLNLHPIVAMFLAYGLISVRGWSLALAARRGWSTPSLKRPLSIAMSLLLALVAVPLWHVRDQLRDHTDSRRLAQAWIEGRFPPGWTIVVPPQLAFDTRALEDKGSHVTVVDLKSAQDAGGLRQLLSGVQEPAVIMVPRWGADPRFEGQTLANALNEASRHWRVLKTFGTKPVLVNYSQPTANGDPAFAIALLDRGGPPPH